MHKHLNLHGQFTGLFWLAVSIFICVMSLQLGFGTFRTPGPGFLLFWAGIILGILGIILWFLANAKNKEIRKTLDLWKGLKWNKVIFVLVALYIYIFLLPKVGYLITTFVFLVFLFSIMERSRMWIQVAFALITATATYVVFYLWLGVQLPRGIF